MLLGITNAYAQEQTDLRPKIGVGEVKIAPMLIEAVGGEGNEKIMSMGRTVEAIDGHLIDRMHNTRKFRVISRSDLDAILQEQDFSAGGSVDEADGGTERFMIASLDYLLITSVDDYQDYVEKAVFEGTGREATKRVVRLGVVAKLYDTSTGELLESAAIQLGPDDPDYDRIKDISSERPYSTKDGELSDRLLVRASQVMAERVALRVLDVLYPAKVLAKTGSQVTINRGDGGGIATDQIWNVYALGEELIDPDTGISLGREEVKVGMVKITDVQPLFSRGQVLEDNGIDKLQVLRLAPPDSGARATR
jgi:hypothetical protein